MLKMEDIKTGDNLCCIKDYYKCTIRDKQKFFLLLPKKEEHTKEVDNEIQFHKDNGEHVIVIYLDEEDNKDEFEIVKKYYHLKEEFEDRLLIFKKGVVYKVLDNFYNMDLKIESGEECGYSHILLLCSLLEHKI